MKKHIIYYGWIYLIYALISLSFTLTIFHQIQALKANEKLAIFFAGEGIQVNVFEEDALSTLSTMNESEIRQVSLEYLSTDLISFEEILAARSLGGTDVFILPEFSVKSNTGSVLFLPLNEVQLKLKFGDQIKIYYENEQPYGIILNSEDVYNVFTSYLAEGDPNRYILFFGAYSQNLGDLSALSRQNDDAAIALVTWLLEER